MKYINLDGLRGVSAILCSIVVVSIMSGCGSTPRSHTISEIDPVEHKTFSLETLTTSGAISINSSTLGGGAAKATGGGVAVGAGSISGSNVMPADSQIIMAAQEVEFMLIERGFRPAPLGSSGDFLVRFSIATVRRDPIAGWIADEASLQIYVAEDRELIAVIMTEANFVTPTVSSIVDSLMDEFDKVI